MSDGLKDTNPKALEGIKKIPLASVPAITSAYLALGHHEGKSKYGGWNWRIAGASASTYISAAKRHLDLWFEGEESDPQTGVPHLANALACISIIVDATSCGKLEDDRPPHSMYQTQVRELHATVERLNIMFADRNPEHFTNKGELNKLLTAAFDARMKNESNPSLVQQSGASKRVRAKVPANKTPRRR